MTLRTPAFNDAKQYDFAYLRHLAETLLNSEGVANYQTDMVVTNAATGLRVDIAAGAAWVKGDSGTPGMGISQGLFSVVNDAAVANAVTLPAAHASNPRLDAIVLKVRDSSDLGSGADDAIFDYVQGTATAGATLLNRTGAAAIPNDCLHLADVLVPATATNLTAANIRDRRLPANGRATRYVAAAETTTSSSFVELATLETVDLYIPGGGAVVDLTYNALGKVSSGAQAGQVALFIRDAAGTSNQAKRVTQNAPAAVADGGGIDSTFYAGMELNSSFYGVQYTADVSGSVDADFATTGLIGNNGRSLFGLPAGNYTLGMRYKVSGGATFTVKQRYLSAAVRGHGRSA